jgi:O-antigen/teichoic acid export membrane protein
VSVVVPPVIDAPLRPGFRRLARDSAVYASGSVAGKAIGLLLLPIVTRLLGPADFGRLDVLTTLHSAATSVLLLGLDTGATRLYADLDAQARRRLFGSWLALTGVVVVPFGLTLVLSREVVSRLLFDTDDYSSAVAFTAMAITGAMVQLVTLTVLRNQGRPPAYAVVSAGSLLVNGALVVTLLAWRPEVTVVLAALAVSTWVGACVGLTVAGRRSFGRPDLRLSRDLLVLGLPLLPAVAATWVAEFANRAILLHTAGPIEVGYFSVAARFGSVALLLVVGFQIAWQPRAFAGGERDLDALRRVAADGHRIMVVVGAGVVILAVGSPELVRLAAGPGFAAALPAVGLSLVFALGLAAYHVVTMPSALSRRMRDLGLAASVAAAVGVALNCWWSPAWGSAGTAGAVAVGQFAGVAVGLHLARSQAPVPYEMTRLVLVVLGAAGAVLIATVPDGGAPVGVRLTLLILTLLALARTQGPGSRDLPAAAVRPTEAARRPPG